MICSLFPGTFSIWYAGIINIVFAVLTLWCVRRIVAEMTHSDWAISAASIIFVGSAGILSNLAFLRMYVMTLFFVTYVTYLMLKMIKTENPLESIGIIAVVSVFGALTHYYFIVYLFFSCFFTGIYLLIKKSYKQLGMLVLSMGVAGCVSVLIFPSMLQHMFEEGRGKQSISNLTNFADYAERLGIFYNIINKELFGNLFTYLAVFILILLIGGFFSHKAKGRSNELGSFIEHFDWFLLVLPSICYFLIVAKMAVYNVDRYIFPIYAVVLIWTVCIVYEFGKYFLGKRYQYIAAALLLSIAIVDSWEQCPWEYLYSSSTTFLNVVKQYKDMNCVYIYICDDIYDDAWKIQQSYNEIAQYNSVVFWNVNNMDAINNKEYCMDQELIVCIQNNCDQRTVLDKILSFCPFLDSYEKLGGFGYATTYHLYGNSIELPSHGIYRETRMEQ